MHKKRIIPRVEKETHVAKKSKYRGTRAQHLALCQGIFEHFMFGEYNKLKKTLETERYPNKFTNGLVISDDTAMAGLDCT